MDNVYAPPKSNLEPQITGSLIDRLKKYDDKSLNKLYYRSCNVSAIAGLMIIGVAILASLFLFTNVLKDTSTPSTPAAVLIAILAFNLIASVGIILRTTWGRVLGIVACTIMLINIPMGTIIGIVGLFAFINAKSFFGIDRITHTELKKEFKFRKANRKSGRA
jgi:hypothetical protein